MKRFISVLLVVCMLILCATPIFALDNKSTKECGDADLNGRVTIKDATLIQKHIAHITTMSEEQLAVSDVDGNSKTNIVDATLIQKKLAFIISVFPVEKGDSTPDESVPETTAQGIVAPTSGEAGTETSVPEVYESEATLPEVTSATEATETKTEETTDISDFIPETTTLNTEAVSLPTDSTDPTEEAVTTVATEPEEDEPVDPTEATEATDELTDPATTTDSEEVTTPTENTTEITEVTETTEATEQTTETTAETTVTAPETTVAETTVAETTLAVSMENFGAPDSIEGDELTPEMLWIVEEEFFRLVNEERVKNGVAPLTYNKHLDEVAQIRSAEIIESFSHTKPDGTNWSTTIDTNKYPYTECGENICAIYHCGNYYKPFDGSEEQLRAAGAYAFERFKNSPGHYNNMLYYGYTDAGMGISYIWDAEREAYRFYISHNFGSLVWIYPD